MITIGEVCKREPTEYDKKRLKELEEDGKIIKVLAPAWKINLRWWWLRFKRFLR